MALFVTTAVLLLTGASPQAGATPAKVDPNERVCKRRIATGTRFAKQTCRSRADWELISEQAKRQAAEEFTKPTISIEKGN